MYPLHESFLTQSGQKIKIILCRVTYGDSTINNYIYAVCEITKVCQARARSNLDKFNLLQDGQKVRSLKVLIRLKE